MFLISLIYLFLYIFFISTRSQTWDSAIHFEWFSRGITICNQFFLKSHSDKLPHVTTSPGLPQCRKIVYVYAVSKTIFKKFQIIWAEYEISSVKKLGVPVFFLE